MLCYAMLCQEWPCGSADACVQNATATCEATAACKAFSCCKAGHSCDGKFEMHTDATRDHGTSDWEFYFQQQ